MKKLKDKTIVPAWDCSVINNEVVIADQKAFDTFLVPFEGKENLQLILKRKVKARSRQEEKFYHSVVVRMVADAMCCTDDEAHEYLKRLLLRVEESITLDTGKRVRYTRIGSTTELGDKAYREYWEDCIRWASLPTKDTGLSPTSGLALYIPYPNEAEWDGREEYERAIHSQ